LIELLILRSLDWRRPPGAQTERRLVTAAFAGWHAGAAETSPAVSLLQRLQGG
jgi:hypothetical protein